MAHLRKRLLTLPLKKSMEFSPLVGVMGHRQVGKTTLLEGFAEKYFTLDRKSERDEATRDPARYIKDRAGKWVVFDECQVVPDLFPELKDWVRTHKKPGQFILSGSIRFTSREAIRESLTGRIVNLELLPFVLSELGRYPLPQLCRDAIETESFASMMKSVVFEKTAIRYRHALMRTYFENGGLPGVCFIRDERIRGQRLEEQLNTMLDRDLRMVRKIFLSLSKVRSVIRALGRMQGEPLDYTRLKSESAVSTPTIKKLIQAFEAMYLIRLLPIEGGTSGMTIFFEGQAERRSLLSEEPTPYENLSHFAFTQARAPFVYAIGESTESFQYRTRGGARIPIAYRNKMGVLGIIPLIDPGAISTVMGSVNSFLKTYGKAKVLILHPETEVPQIIQSRVLLAPIGLFI